MRTRSTMRMGLAQTPDCQLTARLFCTLQERKVFLVTPSRKQDLFIISGASGVGKSTLCQLLFQEERDYIVMESDLLWQDFYNTPEDDYREYRRMWMRVCASISQIGLPVVLCGCAVPKQFESQPERSLFRRIHYLAAVCGEEALEERLTKGRGVADPDWLESSRSFNRWLKEHAARTEPEITLLDTTALTPRQAAEQADRWIHERLEENA